MFRRATIEHAFRLAKQEAGLMHYAGRQHVGLVRHLVMAVVVLGFVAEQTQRLRGENPEVTAEQVCLLRDRVPAYISWERYEENRRRFTANDLGGRSNKAATVRAPTLLNGIGRCGKPMGARNARASAHPRYACDSEHLEYSGPRCQSLVAAYPDRLVGSLVLKAVEPAALELSLRAAERAAQDRGRLHALWKQRLERAGYEADRAKRQYDAVEPETPT